MEQKKLAATLRDIVWAVGYLAKIKGHDASDVEANLALIEKLQNGYKPEGQWAPRNYEKGVLANYAENIHQLDELYSSLDRTIEQIYELAQPKPHLIQIIRITED